VGFNIQSKSVTAQQKAIETIQELPQQSPEVLKSLPKKERGKIANVQIEASIVRVGPLPDPHELERYSTLEASTNSAQTPMDCRPHEHAIKN